MKAPDKIYIYREPPKNYFEDGWVESKADDVESVPYIRKEAILEWAKQKQYESLTIVADNFWQEVIDKIESL